MPPLILSSKRESCKIGVLAVDDASWWLLLSSCWRNWWSSVWLFDNWLACGFESGCVCEWCWWWWRCWAKCCNGGRKPANTPDAGGGNSRPRRQLLTISSPKNEPNCSTFCKGGGSNGVAVVAVVVLFCVFAELAIEAGVGFGMWIDVDGEDIGWLLWLWFWRDVVTAENEPVTYKSIQLGGILCGSELSGVGRNALFLSTANVKIHIRLLSRYYNNWSISHTGSNGYLNSNFELWNILKFILNIFSKRKCKEQTN